MSRVLTDTPLSTFDRILRQEVAHDKGWAKFEVSHKPTTDNMGISHFVIVPPDRERKTALDRRIL